MDGDSNHVIVLHNGGRLKLRPKPGWLRAKLRRVRQLLIRATGVVESPTKAGLGNVQCRSDTVQSDYKDASSG